MHRHPACLPAHFSCRSTSPHTYFHPSQTCATRLGMLDMELIASRRCRHLGTALHGALQAQEVRGPAERISHVHRCLSVSMCLQNKTDSPRLKCSANTDECSNGLYDTILISSPLMRCPMMRQCTTYKASSFPWPSSSCFTLRTAAPVR